MIRTCQFVQAGDLFRCSVCGREVRCRERPTAACGAEAKAAASKLCAATMPSSQEWRPSHWGADLADASQAERLVRTDAPSFLTKIKNFAFASAKHVAAGMPMASDSEIIRRHDICTDCEFFKDNACQKCGCPVVREKQYVSKLSWADSECPVGKWGKEQ